ncbi:phospho-N-acetylmuramoyl-pentapeptide-transferase [Buchnera aphidicola str. Bp (Baizongia pistaciae)]|uniref:Phospho-N-acetylmuramoyl-pentapeptide-transferase n=1 Tax=Buchnera aphidicola subsp. Baizongia pistaciae (strain Bp) TaxID=224915 RepID=MRAY_BUCBP|nr:phospho-N-acetylmuramoyl-pentapeptide-transferase [Buchnera aphidicola]P59436.1 RecName: Full=Phospho-N-acetylmuramoyl-pentapeptide-transferase; AltName: Full=UDP-MurNAc-pentapeptide phosphotransferase [Buchnera aphidicola str. Bp (Baizongia pistaciae)]AAO26933.1 phospho-N-acetylmuramoyl-pentapeptide-transferase [Buchnera aphidicola str. Bp (Baizongia pistaciae)]
MIIRFILSFFTSLLLMLIFGPHLINWLNKYKIQQIIRNFGPKSHFNKKNTPTMGGILIIFSIIISTIIWTKLSNPYVWLTLTILIGYGIIGFIDDNMKIYYKNSKGLSSLHKFSLLSILACIIIFLIYYIINDHSTIKLIVPFSKNIIFNTKMICILISYFAIIGTSNAVNLTDGLDGLAIVPIIFVTTNLSIISFISGNVNLSYYFNTIYIPYSNELTIICAAIIGSSLGFLWFNTYPAQIFMGDVGSLSLGGTIGIISVLLRQEILLIIVGGLFVIETLSVIIQVLYYKITKKKLFKMTPIHHHYELNGCPETRLIIRFWIISFILMLLGLLMLKVHQ